MTGDQNGSASARITAPEHLADARLHLARCLFALKAAATAEPSLVTALGSRYAHLQAEAEELERIQCDPAAHRGAGPS